MFVEAEDPKEAHRVELHACLDRLIDLDPVMSGAAMTAVIGAAHQVQMAAEGAMVAVGAAWHTSGDWEQQGYASATNALSCLTGRRRRASHDVLRTASVARDAPALRAAAADGVLPLTHLSMIARCRIEPLVELFDRDQQFLVDTATTLTAEQLASFLATWRRRARESLQANDPDPDPGPLTEADRIHITRTFMDRHLIDGELSPESAAIIISAVQDRIDDWHRTGALVGDDRSPAELFAAALVDVCLHGPGTGLKDGAPRPSLICLADLDLLCDRAGITDPTDRALLHADILRGGTIGRDTLNRLFCEADTSLVLTHDGEPLYVGRSQRIATPAQRRALLARSGGQCEVPGCHNIHADAHHITWWEHQGPTDLDNLTWICTIHHHQIHKRHITCTRGPTGPEFKTKTGTPIQPRYG